MCVRESCALQGHVFFAQMLFTYCVPTLHWLPHRAYSRLQSTWAGCGMHIEYALSGVPDKVCSRFCCRKMQHVLPCLAFDKRCTFQREHRERHSALLCYRFAFCAGSLPGVAHGAASGCCTRIRCKGWRWRRGRGKYCRREQLSAGCALRPRLVIRLCAGGTDVAGSRGS